MNTAVVNEAESKTGIDNAAESEAKPIADEAKIKEAQASPDNKKEEEGKIQSVGLEVADEP